QGIRNVRAPLHQPLCSIKMPREQRVLDHPASAAQTLVDVTTVAEQSLHERDVSALGSVLHRDFAHARICCELAAVQRGAPIDNGLVDEAAQNVCEFGFAEL